MGNFKQYESGDLVEVTDKFIVDMIPECYAQHINYLTNERNAKVLGKVVRPTNKDDAVVVEMTFQTIVPTDSIRLVDFNGDSKEPLNLVGRESERVKNKYFNNKED